MNVETNSKLKCVIDIEDWQMQCCGDPFKIGDTVEWIIHRLEDYNAPPENGAEYYYEHHSSEWNELFMVIGVVTEIKAQYYKHEKRTPTEKHPQGYIAHIYKKSVNVNEADGWDEDIGKLKFGGYAVALTDFTIRPANKEEVTFS